MEALFETYKEYRGGSNIVEEGVYCSADPAALSHRVVARCPAIACRASWYSSPWLLRSGHTSTIWAALRRRAETIRYSRECLLSPDGGTLGLDTVEAVVTPTETMPAASGNVLLVILVPGLGGSSEDSYVRSMAAAVIKAGYRCAVVNSRGCGGVEVSSPQLFSARRGSTDDLRYVLSSLARSLCPRQRMVAVGWSNGGSILLNTLREYDERGDPEDVCPLTAAVTLSVPYNMSLPSRAMSSTFGKTVYDRNFVKSLMPKVDAFLRRWSHELPHIDDEAVRSSETLQDIEAHLISPMFGYESVQEYYRDASTANAIPHIRIPTLCITAGDDPIALSENLPLEAVAASGSVAMAYTANGGHIGWPDSYTDSKATWAEGAALQFISAAVSMHNAEA